MVLCLFGIVSTNMAVDYKFNLAGDKHQKGFVSVASDHMYKEGGYGYDLGTHPNDGKPFFFSVDVPEGNYLVKVVLGSKDVPSRTTVKAESRRLMLKNIETKKGEFITHEFAINIRNTKISETESVKIKPREIGKLIWDNKLTLEFNGDNPSVQSIEIKSADNLITLFLAGNSTVVDEANEPWCGWGQVFPLFFTSKVAIANYAESGEAANTFVSSKRFAKLLTKIKKGDYLFIEFGHNDQKQKGEGKGPYASYTSDLKYLVDEARKKGANPVLVTSMHRRSFDENGKVINTHGEYPNAVRLLAKEENVPLINLNNMSKELYEAWGVEGSKKAFVHYPAGTFPDQDKALEDNTHFNPYGGYEIARCIIKGIIESNLPIKKYIKKGYRNYNPAHPDAFDTFHIPLTPFSSTIKPD
ncbi:rhamnogalacturonan acetylesterase [Dysgonomonas sp. HDW5B]|nr:rhamnogalacturonan acetylesterase [Dysgonomonas sp. HDW5B]